MKTIIVIFLLVVMVSCDKQSSLELREYGYSDTTASDGPFMMSPVSKPLTIDRKLIKNGSLEISVEDVELVKSEIKTLCKSYDGYLSSETQSSFPQRIQYDQVIRVPAAKFDELVKKLEALATEVDNKNIETIDVTDEFIDKEARIKTKKELEERYLEILKKANAVSDMLAIESQLNEVRADIEAMEGRLQYLNNQVSYSALNLTFYKPLITDYGFTSKLLTSAREGWNLLLSFIIGLLRFWPFIVMLVVISFLFFRRRKMKKQPLVN
jgi:hypothetical protein